MSRRFSLDRGLAHGANNTFPAIQGVALTADHANVLVTGTTAAFGSSGGLYLDEFKLST